MTTVVADAVKLVAELLSDSGLAPEIERVWVEQGETCCECPCGGRLVQVWVITDDVNPRLEVRIFRALSPIYDSFALPSEVDVRIFPRRHFASMEMPEGFVEVLSRAA